VLVEAVSGETPSYIGNFSGCTVVRVVGMVMQGANHSKNKKKKKKNCNSPELEMQVILFQSTLLLTSLVMN
jgi:rRNA processing protein Krr1/Pno1